MYSVMDFVAIVFTFSTLISIRSLGNSDKEAKHILEVSQSGKANVQSGSYELSKEAITIIYYFEKSDEFLEANFSLEYLAREVSMSKHQVSEVLNNVLNVSFYQLLAKYRIKHAKKMIEQKRNLTIDAIVEECGFSSKTTFNKYFKQFVGETPSVYRSKIV